MATTLGRALGTRLGTELDNFAEPGPVAPGIHYVNAFTAANYYAAPVGTMLGSASGFFWGEILMLESGATSATRIIFGNVVTSGRGYNSFTSGAHANFTRGMWDGAGALQYSVAGYTVPATSLDKWMHTCYVFTGSVLRQYICAAAIGADVAVTGYLLPTTSQPMIGRRSDGFAASKTRFAAAYYGTGVPSAADIAAHYGACQSLNDVSTTMPGATMVETFSVKRMNASSAPPELTSSPGSTTMTRVGSALGFGIDSNPGWGM